MEPDSIQQKVLQVTKSLEKQVDAAIEQIDKLDVNDIEGLRKQRVKELKELEAKRQEWMQNGHGSFEELAEEKMFFDIIKKSANVIIHFFTRTNTRCPIVDKHMKILAPKHMETKFVKLNAEKCPFLAERLKIKVIPTLVCIQNGIMVDKVVGFTTLGNRDDFSTAMLEWRLAQNKVIDYDGDLTTPPGTTDFKAKQKSKSSIREGVHNNESDDDLEQEDFTSYFQNNSDLLAQNVAKNGSLSLTREEELELGLVDDDHEKPNDKEP